MKLKILTLALLCTFFCYGSENQKICLNMIVKNEKAVIERCLNSVKPFIDYWVIVDTGSTDGTQELIEKCMAGIPGELHESEWVNFEVNRNEALELAKAHGDYLMFIDADEYIKADEGFKLPHLDSEMYCIKSRCEGLAFGRVQFAKSEPELRWKDVLHEYLDLPGCKGPGLIKGIENISTTEGARSKDPAKLLRDAMVLEEELANDPENARYRFYLAQSYRCHGDKEMALENYKKRVAIGGDTSEMYDSMLHAALLEQELQPNETVYRDNLLKAFRYRPERVEPLYHLAVHYRQKGDYQLAYFFARLGMSAPPTNDIMNVQEWMTTYGLLFELSIAAYYVGEYEQSLLACNDLLKNSTLPMTYRIQTQANRKYAMAKIPQPRQKRG